MSYVDFPEPPSQSQIRVERDRSGLVLSWEHVQEVPEGQKGCANAFLWAWMGMIFVFALAGVGFCWLLIGSVLGWNEMEAPQGFELVLFAGFFVLWFGMLTWFFVIGRRMQAVVSGKVPDVGWRVSLQPTEWSVTQYRSGKAATTRVDPRQIRRLAVDSKNCVVAQLTERRVELTTPLLDDESEWLSESLGQVIGQSIDEKIPVYPYVPRGDLTDTPGSVLAFRLSSGSTASGGLMGCFIFALLWNAGVCVGVVSAVYSHVIGEPQWGLTFGMVPFVLVGLLMLAVFFHELAGRVGARLVGRGIGPTVAEISDHPLRPGGRYEVHLSQSGRLTMNSLRVLLVCEEEVTYTEGTDERTETTRVHQQELLFEKRFEIRKGRPFDARFDLQIPPGAMHSFETYANEVKWKLLVQADVANRPDFERVYPLVVYPPDPTRSQA